MVIVLLGIQFYQDVAPVFTEGDSFFKKDYVIISRKVSTLGTFVGKSNTFSESDIREIAEQEFTKGVGRFTSSSFKVSAGVGMEQLGLNLSTSMFFESVPDQYVDVNLQDWHFEPGQELIPIIIPRNYLDLYNFGFAQSRGLPQISEGVINMVNLEVKISGKNRRDTYKGKIVGFSNRLNTILVPQSFMTWANNHYADDSIQKEPSRLIVEVNNPADERIAQFLRERGYESEGDKLDAGKTAWFLKMIVGIVMAVGLLISILSFYILMLSVYLLLQKNTTKLENLLLIGYGPTYVAMPYQVLTIGLNVLVLLVSIGLVCCLRTTYLEVLERIYPTLEAGTPLWTILVGLMLFVIVSLINVWAIRKKIASLT
jgi:small nuclear ribonucleoprotein (snRNP)-like protein